MLKLGDLLIIIAILGKTDAVSRADSEYPQVQISSGPIRGVQKTSSWTNRTFFAFQGVPYAAPPVAALRFKDPIDPTNWTSVKNCTLEQASCYQPSSMFKNNESSYLRSGMSEDCLYLNIYTTQLQPEGGLLPVLVWIHGGAFITGSGNYSTTGPDWLLAEGIVVVTLNYRLGAFGFLTLGTSDAPGNSGLKDQRLALKWVQREIKNFGGDASRVTLFGESAGSACVHPHYLSPISVGLFQQAIGDSGTSLAEWAVKEDGTPSGLWLAKEVNCAENLSIVKNLSSILQCLRNVDAMELLSAQSKKSKTFINTKRLYLNFNVEQRENLYEFFSTFVQIREKEETTRIYLCFTIPITIGDKGGSGELVLNFVPTVDKCSEEPFLPEIPEELSKKGQGSFVPFLMGTNRDEGVLGLGGFSNVSVGEDTIKNVKQQLQKFIPDHSKQNYSEEKIKYFQRRISDFYFNGSTPSFSNLKGYLDLFSDAYFSYSTALSARRFSDRGKVYLYYFTFEGAFKEVMVMKMESLFNISLVAHAEELNYLFVSENVNQTADESSNEITTRKRMVRMWSNFVKKGVPADGRDSLLQEVDWLPVTVNALRHLVIDTNLTMNHSDYLAQRIAFWDKLLASSSSAHSSEVAFSIIITVSLFWCWVK